MKYLILAFVILGCAEASYKKGEQVCAYGVPMTITDVNTFISTGAGLRGANYECRYLDKHGVLQTTRIYEKEIETCK